MTTPPATPLLSAMAVHLQMDYPQTLIDEIYGFFGQVKQIFTYTADMRKFWWLDEGVL
jgi:hypothetical protein